jgi:LssY C-terminus
MPCANRRSLLAYTLLFLLSSCSWGQEMREGLTHLIIPDGTPVKLQMVRTISSAHAREGDRLDFVVVKDVTVGGSTIIQAGTVASGSVLKVEGKRLLGIGGNVVIKLDSVDLITGQEVALRARKVIKGSSRTKLMLAEMIITSLFYLPAAPVFLLSRGHDSTVLKGTEVTAYIDGDSVVQTAKLLRKNSDVSELREMINFLPPHTLDGQGHEGDMLNLVFIAKRDDLEMAFERAGWLKTDKSKPTIFWHLLQQRKHYTKLPMAKLYVFGRAQDYSYALPEPTSIVARRHHLRVWKTDYEMDGAPIWVGAATHDVSIQIQMKELRIVHRIDPEVDVERDFIGTNLADTRLVAHEEYLHSVDPVFEGQTATGGTYYSDSRILLVELHQGKSANSGLQRAATTLERGTGGGMASINASR